MRKRKALGSSRIQITLNVTPDEIRALVAAHHDFFGSPTKLYAATADTQRAFARAWLEVTARTTITRAVEEIEQHQADELRRATGE